MAVSFLAVTTFKRFVSASNKIQTERKQIQFSRHKVIDRTGTTVEIPIMEEMELILDRQANSPKRERLIFPYLKNHIGDEIAENKITGDIGNFISKSMKKIASIIGLPEVPTATWARHSFATNLIQNGVPKDYVSWAMAHSDNSITGIYISAYSYEQMVEYNALLLCNRRTKEHILAQIRALADDDKLEVYKQLKKDLKKA